MGNNSAHTYQRESFVQNLSADTLILTIRNWNARRGYIQNIYCYYETYGNEAQTEFRVALSFDHKKYRLRRLLSEVEGKITDSKSEKNLRISRLDYQYYSSWIR